MVVLFVVLSIIIALTIDYLVQRFRHKAAVLAPVAARELGTRPQALAITTAPPPSTFVTPSHTWLDLLPSGSVRVGVDGLVATVIGAPDRVTCAAEGTMIARDAPLVSLRRGERELVLRAPVDGMVEKVQVPVDPAAFARQPYGTSWICQLRPRAVGPALREARIGQEACSWLRAELSRLRDVLCGLTAAHRGAAVVAADGGYPIPDTAAALDAEEWEVLVRQFFGRSDQPRSARDAVVGAEG